MTAGGGTQTETQSQVSRHIKRREGASCQGEAEMKMRFCSQQSGREHRWMMKG